MQLKVQFCNKSKLLAKTLTPLRLDCGETGGVHSAVDVDAACRVPGARQHGQGERFELGQLGGEKTGWKHSASAATTQIQRYAS